MEVGEDGDKFSRQSQPLCLKFKGRKPGEEPTAASREWLHMTLARQPEGI